MSLIFGGWPLWSRSHLSPLCPLCISSHRWISLVIFFGSLGQHAAQSKNYVDFALTCNHQPLNSHFIPNRVARSLSASTLIERCFQMPRMQHMWHVSHAMQLLSRVAERSCKPLHRMSSLMKAPIFKPFNLALVQLGNVGADKASNLRHARSMILRAATGDGESKPKPDLIVLPVRVF
jgi:hypothetical protein